MAITWLNIPAMRHWDVASNEKHDVLKHGSVLMRLVAEGYINGSHLAVPCNSLSWARHPQLRSILAVYGVDNLNPRQHRKVEDGNKLVKWSTQFCAWLHSHDGYFSIENPFPSWFWCMPEVRQPWCMKGVIHVLVTFQEYFTPWYKLTGLLTNLPTGYTLDLLESNVAAKIQLRGHFEWHGQRLMKTSKQYL